MAEWDDAADDVDCRRTGGIVVAHLNQRVALSRGGASWFEVGGAFMKGSIGAQVGTTGRHTSSVDQ